MLVILYNKLAGYLASLGFPPSLPPSLPLTTWLHPGYLQCNRLRKIAFPRYFLKLETLKSWPLKLPLCSGRGVKMYQFSWQLLKFPRLLKFWPLKLPTPRVGWGEKNVNIDFLGSLWHFRNFWICDTLKSPLGPGPKVVSKKGGVQTNRQTDTHTKEHCRFI